MVKILNNTNTGGCLMRILKAKLIHKAFETEPVHIATYTPGYNEKNKDVHWILEDIFKSSQNLMDSWSNSEIVNEDTGFKYDGSKNFTWVKSVKDNPKNKEGYHMGHRSTSCGDLVMVFTKDVSDPVQQFKTQYYFCAMIGWKEISKEQFEKICKIDDEIALQDYFLKANLGKELV
mgnify:FL=1